MSLKTTFMYLFVGLNIFSMNLKASENNMDVEAKRHHHSCSKSCHHHHRHCFKFKDIAELLLLAEFRQDASRFILTSSQRTFDVWGHHQLIALVDDQEIALADEESFDITQMPTKADLERYVAESASSASDRVLSFFTLTHAFAAAASSNAALKCHEFLDFEKAWIFFALADIRQTREPNSLLRSIFLVASAVNVGAEYDKCLHLTDESAFRQMQSKVAAVASKLGSSLEENPELQAKFRSFTEAKFDAEFPVFEVLFGIIGSTRVGANFFARQASRTFSPPDHISAEIIYTISQLFVEASADLMDIATFGISVIGLIENHHHSD